MCRKERVGVYPINEAGTSVSITTYTTNCGNKRRNSENRYDIKSFDLLLNKIKLEIGKQKTKFDCRIFA